MNELRKYLRAAESGLMLNGPAFELFTEIALSKGKPVSELTLKEIQEIDEQTRIEYNRRFEEVVS